MRDHGCGVATGILFDILNKIHYKYTLIYISGRFSTANDWDGAILEENDVEQVELLKTHRPLSEEERSFLQSMVSPLHLIIDTLANYSSYYCQCLNKDVYSIIDTASMFVKNQIMNEVKDQ